MTTTPKTFVATGDFTVGSRRFTKGDVVPHGRTLAYLLSLDCGFVAESTTSKTTTPKEGSTDGADQ